jgi:Alpha/beta hydrolase domain
MHSRCWIVVAITTVASMAALANGTPTDGAASPDPYTASATLTGPVTTGHIIEPLSISSSDLAAHHYVEQEFFASGTAYAFHAESTPADGRWSIEPAGSAPYTTRIVVRRPASVANFNGTVVVEWMNVTAGESAPDWTYLNPMLMRDGYAYVGVSAQSLGVEGGQAILGAIGPGAGLVHEEPSRYGDLHHPGDQFALDMFAQIGRALRPGQVSDALGDLRPRHVVAVGESQSAFYLTTFADALQPKTHAFDGIFIHSRGGGGVGLSSTSVSSGLRGALRIRTDLSVPVFMFETQTDLTTLGYAIAQQPNTSRIRTWEVAGTSHADAYLVGNNAKFLGCAQPVNDGPQHQVVQAAFTAFEGWVVHGTAPPTPPPFRLTSTNPPVYAVDKYGNVIGGVRTPAVDVPISTLSGQAPAGASVLCSLFGSATPLSTSTLTSLYPTKADYVAAYTKSLDRAIRQGYILPADRTNLLAQAKGATVP